MRLWIIVMLGLSGLGVAYYFLAAEDAITYFLAGFLFGSPLGVLFIRGAVHKYLKPEWYEKFPNN